MNTLDDGGGKPRHGRFLLGAEVPYYFECSDAVEAQFNRTGDDARSLLSELGALADTGMKILIWVCVAC